jgi:hypothetical protein
MNTISVLKIYKYNGLWVFDDADKGLLHEAFVSGADVIIDLMVRNIANAKDGFSCIFSKNPFPSSQYELKLKTRGNDIIGNWYTCEALGIDGWLCGSLYKYFDVEPESIFIQVKEIEHEHERAD